MICLKTIIRYDIVSIVIDLFIEEDECEDQGKDESKRMKINYKITRNAIAQTSRDSTRSTFSSLYPPISLEKKKPYQLGNHNACINLISPAPPPSLSLSRPNLKAINQWRSRREHATLIDSKHYRTRRHETRTRPIIKLASPWWPVVKEIGVS